MASVQQRTTMFNLKEVLWNTLENLKDEQFKHFKWFLKQEQAPIPEARLENADRQDTVDLMVQKYGSQDALEVTKKILEKISRNDLVQHLSSSFEEPKNHNNAPLKREYEKQKATLEETRTKVNTMIQERQMKISEIKRSAELSKTSADRQTKDSEQILTGLLRSVGRILENLIKAIQEKQDVSQKQAERSIQELQKEIKELTTKGTELEKLSHIQDHSEFLQSCSSLQTPPPTKNWTEVSVPPPSYGQNVAAAVDELKQEVSKDTEKMIANAKLIRVQQFAVDVTLDPDTANPYLVLSADGKRVHYGDKRLHVSENLKRFTSAINVLGKQSISSGRFYYEVQVKGSSSWDLGVVRESVNRKGSITAKPEDGYWTICLRSGREFRASSKKLTVKSPPENVGVFVDYNDGCVSFFDVDSADLLHSFRECSFDGNLYPFFSPSLHRGEDPRPLIIYSVSNLG